MNFKVGDSVEYVSGKHDIIVGTVVDVDDLCIKIETAPHNFLYDYKKNFRLHEEAVSSVSDAAEDSTRASHYLRLTPSTVQRFHDARSSDEFIGAMLFNITKYAERFGHKDDKLNEALKIRDYAQMLVNHLEGKKIQ